MLAEFSQEEESVEQRTYAFVVVDLTAEIAFESDEQVTGVLQVVFVHVVFQQLNEGFERVGTGVRVEIGLAVQRGQLEEDRSDVFEIQLLAMFQDWRSTGFIGEDQEWFSIRTEEINKIVQALMVSLLRVSLDIQFLQALDKHRHVSPVEESILVLHHG